jgi:hypothetical protein
MSRGGQPDYVGVLMPQLAFVLLVWWMLNH